MTPPNRPPGPAAVLFDLEGVLVRHEVDIEEVRLRLAALFGPHGVTRPFRPILRRIREAAAEVGDRGAGSGDRGAGSGSGSGGFDAAPARERERVSSYENEPETRNPPSILVPVSSTLDLEHQAYAIVDEFELAAATRARAKPGALELLAALAARSVPLGLYTERGRACVAPSLVAAGIDPARFSAFGAREDSFPPGPRRPVNPDAPWANAPDYTPAVLAAAQALERADIWLIGDHPDDVKAGRAAASQVPGLMIRTALLRGGPATAAPAGAAPDQMLAALADALALPGVPA